MKPSQPVYFRYRAWWHLLFWSSYVLYDTWIWGSQDDDYSTALLLVLVDLPLKMIATYLTIYLLLPRFFFRQRYKSFIFWLIWSVLTVCFIQRSVEYFYTGPVFFEGRWTESFWHLPYFFHCLIGIYSVVAVATVIVLLKKWYLQQDAMRQMEKEKWQAELKFLRGQINPHFLFNNMNNLYAHALKQSEQTPEIVEKLSDLLQYMLYESASSTVPLQTEIRYLENFIQLEKMRFGDRLDLSFSVFGTCGPARIAPLLLLPLVENSFKHGISGRPGGGWVDIALEVDHYQLTLKITNSLRSKSGGSLKKEGIGLQNVRRRLELLYPKRHQLVVTRHPDRFYVHLFIELNSSKPKTYAEHSLYDRGR